jgi:hypothetical protein
MRLSDNMVPVVAAQLKRRSLKLGVAKLQARERWKRRRRERTSRPSPDLY